MIIFLFKIKILEIDDLFESYCILKVARIKPI